MSLSWERTRAFQVASLDAVGQPDAVVLAVVLVLGMVVLAPLTGWLLGLLGLPGPLPLFAGLALAGGLYGLFALAVNRVALGVVVGTVVTATFAADVPLTASASGYPGSLGPDLWLVHLPLLALVVVLVLTGTVTLESVSRVEYVLGAFVAWSVVVALVGPVARVDVALFFALFSAYALVAFGAARRSVTAGLVTARGALAAFLVAVGGQVVVAAGQLLNQGALGLSVLGETVRGSSHDVVGLGPLGSFHIGVFVSGLTGGSGPLSVLLVVAIPLTLAFAVRRTGLERVGLLVALAAMTATLRFTAKDAARGAVLVALLLFGGYLLWDGRRRLRRWLGDGRPVRNARELGGAAVVLLVALLALFVPSTITPTGGPGASVGGGGGGGVGGGVSSISVPFFNTNTLGIRLAQYLVGLDIFVHHPLTGVGGANFRYVAAGYDVPALDGLALHNLYLSTLVGTGVPGLLLYGLAFLLVLRSGWRLLRTGGTDRTLVAGLLAGLVGFLAVAFWVIPLRFTYVLPFWLLAGVLVGWAERRRGRVDAEPAAEGAAASA